MADYKVVDAEKLEAGLIATADAIREKTGNTEKIDWKENGMADQVDEVFEAGKKSEYDAFWDVYQDYGHRSNYRGAFAGAGWNKNTFSPKYDLCPTIATMMFSYFFYNIPFNLQNFLKEKEIVFDFSNVSECSQTFIWSGIEELGVIDTRKSANISSLFYYAHLLKKIEKLILKEEPQKIDNIFDGCGSLIDITIEGEFFYNLKLKDCKKLSYNSIISVINALSQESSGTTISFSIVAINNAFETAVGAADGSTSEEWLALANTKPNWTISLV